MRETEAEVVRVLCKECRQLTRHTALYSKEVDGADESHDYYWRFTYRVLQCNGCDEITFEVDYIDNATYDREGHPIHESKLYPPRVEGMSTLPEDAYSWLPYNLLSMYREIIGALEGQAGTLAVVGMRAIVEGVCTERSVPRGSFAKRVQGLADLGFLPQVHVPAVPILRDYGNRAAHELKKPTQAEQITLLNIIEQLLRNTYHLPHAAGTLAARST